MFAHGLGLRVGLMGCMFALLTLIGFRIGIRETGMLAGGQTLAFLILSLSQVFQAFNMRSNHSLFKIGPFTNRKLNVAATISILLIALVLFTPLSTAFSLVQLPAWLYLVGLGLSAAPILVMELAKAFGLIRPEY